MLVVGRVRLRAEHDSVGASCVALEQDGGALVVAADREQLVEHFGIDDVRRCDLAMRVDGPDGFVLHGASSMSKISRDPLDLVTHAIGSNHQYPDGLVLFLGTMFAPTEDRLAAGEGFTHVVGDLVTVTTPLLGALVNRVDHSDNIAPWTFGAGALMHNLAARGLLAQRLR